MFLSISGRIKYHHEGSAKIAASRERFSILNNVFRNHLPK